MRRESAELREVEKEKIMIQSHYEKCTVLPLAEEDRVPGGSAIPQCALYLGKGDISGANPLWQS